MNIYITIFRNITFGNLLKGYGKSKNNVSSKMIGRLYFINPSDIERYCLRLLLLNIPVATSFEFLRTVNTVTYSTYQETAIERKLLEDDTEWDQCLSEASFTATANQLRTLFAMILIYNSPSSPAQHLE